MRDNRKGGALTEVTFYILLALHTPRHGYAVMQFIEEKTGGRLSLGGRKKEYAVTPLGREIAERELARLNELAAVAVEIIGGARDEQKVLPVLLEPDGSPGKVAEQDVGQGLAAGAY